ncbi:ATP-binding protein [Paracoccus sp. R86501]|uniref:ATP-binding protein n=1 Tax=Paracoccus sp. R86501 TaxID=3101711 RepID=UPI00366B221E
MEHILHMQTDLDRLDGMLARLTELASGVLSDDKMSSFEIAVMEALTNAVQHAVSPDPDKPIVVTLDIQPDHLRIRIVDAGNRAPDDLYENVPQPHEIDEMAESGRGVPLISLLADHISFLPGDGGNQLEMIFNRDAPQ